MRLGYDAAGRVVEERLEESGVAAALVTAYAHDVDGRVSLVTYPSGLRVKVERDRATGEVRKLSTEDGSLTFADGIARWPGGPLRGFTFGSGEAFSATVNRRYEPGALRSGPLALDYTMTPAGDVERVVEGTTTYQYAYDFRDRLVSSSPATGERQDVVHRYPTSGFYPWNNLDRVKQSGVQGPGGFTLRYAYDYDRQTNVSSIGAYADGHLTAGVCLRHDPLGRLTLVGAGPNAGGDGLTCLTDGDVTAPTARFRYDAANRRVARWSAATGEWTYFLHGPGGELLSEVRKTGDPGQPWAPVRDYVWLDGRPLAQLEYEGATSRPYYVHADHLGTPRKLTSAEGATVWSATVQPYGELAEATTPDPVTGRTVVTNLRLPGQYDERLLGSLGLQGPYYNWNRWYLPSVGRYLELDPIALMGHFNSGFGLEWYPYAGNNPVNYADPDGRASKFWQVLTLIGQLLNPFGPEEGPPRYPPEPPPATCPGPGRPPPPPPPPPKPPKLPLGPGPVLPIFIHPCLIDPRLCGHQPDPFT